MCVFNGPRKKRHVYRNNKAVLSYSGRSRKNGHNALENDNGKATNKKTITTATTTTTKMMVMMTLATTTNKQTCLTIENTKKINLMYDFCVGGEH